MKKIIIAGLVVLGGLSLSLVSCTSNEPKVAAPIPEAVQYKCPMKCSEEIFDKPGKCPVCGMELEKIIKS